MLNNLFKLGAVLLLVPLAGAQQARIYQEGGNWAQEITGTLENAKNVRIQLEAGAVRVEGGARTGVSYTVRNRTHASSEDAARREVASFKVTAYVRGDTAWIIGEWQGGRPHRNSTEAQVVVPQGVEVVKVETGGGSVVGTGIMGSMYAESRAGSIRLDNIGGSVTAETGGDKIEVGSIGGDARIETGGGRVSIGTVKGTINASTGGGDLMLVSGQQGAVLETGGGNIQVQRCGGRLRVSTGGGNIDLGDIDGPVEVATGGGSIRLSSAKGAVRAETGSGRIELNGVASVRAETGAGGIVARFVPGPGRSESLLETAVGDVTVYLPQNLNITVRAAIELANGHSIQSDFSSIQVRTEGGGWGPKTVTAEGTLNGGGPLLKVHTTTGNIVIRRQ